MESVSIMCMLVSLLLLCYIISRIECVLWLVNFTDRILSRVVRDEKCNKKSCLPSVFSGLACKIHIVCWYLNSFCFIFSIILWSFEARALDIGFSAISFPSEGSGNEIGFFGLLLISGATPTPSYARAERNRTAAPVSTNIFINFESKQPFSFRK